MLDTATTSQAISALPPDAKGIAAGLAPVGDEAKPTDLTNSPELKRFLNQIADYCDSQANSEGHWERRRQTVSLRKRITGEYYGIFDKRQGWVSGRNDGDGIYYDPTVATFIDDMVAKLVKSRPKIVCEARNPELIDKREAAKVAEKQLDLDDKNEFTPKKQQREMKTNLLCGGETYRITYFNQSKAGAGFNKEKFEQLEIPGGDEAYYCALCDGTSISDDGNCATCGNPQVDAIKAESTQITVHKGTEFQQVGDTDYDIPDCLEMTVIGETDDIQGSLAVMRERMIPRCVLEAALGQRIDVDTGIPDRLRYKQQFQKGFDGKSTMREFDMLHYREFWLAPAIYAQQKLPRDTELKNGQTAKAGSPYSEAFPDGMYFSQIKEEIYNLYPQSTSECITHTVNSIGDGFHGHGEWDLNELGDQLTEAKSMKFNSMLLDSTHPLMIREGVVDIDAFENKFGVIVPVSDDSKDRSLNDIMGRVPGEGMPEQAYALGEELKGQAQQRVGAFSTNSDASDVKAMGTATGIAAITENTLGRRGPALQLYGQMLVEQAYQKLELRQKYWPKKMYQSVATELGDDAVKWFMQCNIRQDISISVVPDSWMPQMTNERQVNFQAYLGMVGELLAAKGDPKLLDDVIRKAGQIFNIGMDLGDYESESVEAQLRLDAVRDVASFVEKQFAEFLYDQTGEVSNDALMVTYSQAAELLKLEHKDADPSDIFAHLPLDVMFDEHKEFTEAYTDWLRTAEGRAASPFERLLVRQLADYHQQAAAYQGYKQNQYAQLPQVADMQAETVAQEVQHAQDTAHGVQDAQTAAAMQPQPSTGQKIMESINFKDLPPEGQAQLAQQAGVNITPQHIQAAQNPPPAEPKTMVAKPQPQPNA